MGSKKRERDYLAIEVKFSPTDLKQLEERTYVGDPIRKAIEGAAEQENREVDWDTCQTWINRQPTDHNGITVRVFVKAPRRQDEPATD